MIETFTALADRIRDKPTSVTPRFVAIDGPSGAGKSTFALRLARSLGDPPVVEMDDFLSWDDLTGWWPRLEQEVLRPLMGGEPATYQQRDWTHDPRGRLLGNWRTVPPGPLVILEGVTSSRRDAADLLTFTVWIEAAYEVRLDRGVERDGESMRETWVNWMEREEAFFSGDRARDRADLIVDGAPAKPHDPDRQFVLELPRS